MCKSIDISHLRNLIAIYSACTSNHQFVVTYLVSNPRYHLRSVVLMALSALYRFTTVLFSVLCNIPSRFHQSHS